MGMNLKSILIYSTAAVIGPGALGFGIGNLFNEIRRKRWPRLEATVIQSRIEKCRLSPGYECIPIIEFEFEYNGQMVRCTPELFTAGTSETASAILNQYPAGTRVSFLLHRKHPSKSRLNSPITPLSVALIIMGGLVCLAESSWIFY
jgi:hypothetical protein